MGDIYIAPLGNTINVSTPYDRGFVADARALRARWNPELKVWAFDIRDDAAVRDLLRDHFGWIEGEPADQTVTVELSGTEYGAQLTVAGVVLAKRRGRDESVYYDDNVRVREGHFEDSAGSRNNPAVGDLDGIVLEVRDLTATQVEQMRAGFGKRMQIVDEEAGRREALRVERERLLARIAEIDSELAREN